MLRKSPKIKFAQIVAFLLAGGFRAKKTLLVFGRIDAINGIFPFDVPFGKECDIGKSMSEILPDRILLILVGPNSASRRNAVLVEATLKPV